MSQNIYDNEVFFTEYTKLRSGKNYNNYLEQPAISKLLPDVKGKTILDIGCGYGYNCLTFAENGAKKVIGIDISNNMLEIAKEQSSHPCVEYCRMDMSEISDLETNFDIVYSSLAFHYSDNFQKLIEDIYTLLNKGGYLIYSQEHPFVTATIGTYGIYNLNRDGIAESYTFSDYSKSGQRVGTWFVDGVINYHRTMGEIVTTLAHSGLVITDMVEPTPEEWALKEMPELEKEFIKPTFLIIRAKKQ